MKIAVAAFKEIAENPVTNSTELFFVHKTFLDDQKPMHGSWHTTPNIHNNDSTPTPLKSQSTILD